MGRLITKRGKLIGEYDPFSKEIDIDSEPTIRGRINNQNTEVQ
jgi:hypothetical protein